MNIWSELITLPERPSPKHKSQVGAQTGCFMYYLCVMGVCVLIQHGLVVRALGFSSRHQMDLPSVVPSPTYPCIVWNNFSASKQLSDFEKPSFIFNNVLICFNLNVFSSDYSSTELIWYDRLKQSRKERRVLEYQSSQVLLPPNAVPFHVRPVTSWKGLVEISCPAGATPIITDVPQPLWHDSSAAR